MQILKTIEEKSENKYLNSPFERGVGVCYSNNIIYFLIFPSTILISFKYFIAKLLYFLYIYRFNKNPEK